MVDAQVLPFLLEISLVAAALMVVLASCQVQAQTAAPTANLLSFGFVLVAGCNLLSLHHGAEHLALPNSALMTVPLLGLLSSVVESACLWILVQLRGLPGTRLAWLALGVATLGALTIAVPWTAAALPAETHSLADGAHAGPALLNLLAGIWLWLRRHDPVRGYGPWLTTACTLAGVSELANLLGAPESGGWVLKLGAYGALLRAIFLTDLRSPLETLQDKHDRLQDKGFELDFILSNLPVAVIKLDRDLRIRYANAHQAARLSKPAEQLAGLSLIELGLEDGYTGLLTRNMHKVLHGETVSFEAAHVDAQLGERFSQGFFVPERAGDGEIKGVLGFMLDVTEETRIRQGLQQALRETSDLTTALDAHAIVAVTDAHGVITRVNDRFCSISLYERDDLIGQNHRILKSGSHPETFYHGLWQTISAGEVWHGEICNRARDGSVYWVHTTIVPYLGPDGRPYQYVSIRTDITARKRYEQELINVAAFDTLTGLANRKTMLERMNASLIESARSGSYGALLFIGLDDFKKINGAFGYQYGDRLLFKIARRLQNCVRGSDTVARFGGDQFALILSDLGADAEASSRRVRHLGTTILDALGLPYNLDARAITALSSIGVVHYQGLDVNAEDLLQRADLALTEAKETGGNRMCFFDVAMWTRRNEQIAVEADLRMALARGEFRAYYQPTVDTRRQVVGTEALIRWQHPERGLVSPAAFITVAEKTGLILPVGRWMLETACRQLAAWAKAPATAAWTIAVNISAHQLHHEQFVEEVLNVLTRTGADPAKLRLELTESMLIHDLADTIHKMETLRDCGVRFSLDDFGTGYSSLSYLRQLPLDVLKIDKSFVRGIPDNANDASVAIAVLALARSLGLSVIAEGVETDGQFDFLREHGCQSFQGYLFGHPMPTEQLLAEA